MNKEQTKQTIIQLPKWTIEGRENDVMKLWTKIDESKWISKGDKNLIMVIL